MPLDSLPRMNQVITSNRIEVWIGKKSERIPGFLTEVARLFRTIDADGDGTNPSFIKFGKSLLDAPQLGVTKRSPIAAIENEQHTSRWFVLNRLRQKFSQRNCFVASVLQGEVRRFLVDLRGVRRRRQPARYDERCEDEHRHHQQANGGHD